MVGAASFFSTHVQAVRARGPFVEHSLRSRHWFLFGNIPYYIKLMFHHCHTRLGLRLADRNGASLIHGPTFELVPRRPGTLALMHLTP